MMEPLLPHPEHEHEQTIPAADAGDGAPPPSPRFGVTGEEPDDTESVAPEEAAESFSARLEHVETPFRAPQPDADDPADS